MKMHLRSLSEARPVLRVLKGVTDSAEILSGLRKDFESRASGYFKIGYVKVVSADTFEETSKITIPFVIHSVVTNGTINCFDGVLIGDTNDLEQGPPVIWLEQDINEELSKVG